MENNLFDIELNSSKYGPDVKHYDNLEDVIKGYRFFNESHEDDEQISIEVYKNTPSRTLITDYIKDASDKCYVIPNKGLIIPREYVTYDTKYESDLEIAVKGIEEEIYKHPKAKDLSSTSKLYLICSLIFAAKSPKGYATIWKSLESTDDTETNDGTIILDNVREFLQAKECTNNQVELVIERFQKVLLNKILWEPDETKKMSFIKDLFSSIQYKLTVVFDGLGYIDLAGLILNTINNYDNLDNDPANDVVLTPRYVGNLMAKLARVNKDSYVLDKTAGTGGLLISGQSAMLDDANVTITDIDEYAAKLESIKNHQLLGVELLDNVYVLALLNQLLLDNGTANVINADSHTFKIPDDFPADVLLLNPPYSGGGKGLDFAKEAMEQMETGYASILIQDSAGSGQGLPYSKEILERNTLEASIKMPAKLFGNKASVSVCLYVFKVNRKHQEDDIVTFIDFSEDGYTRTARKKSTIKSNLKDTDNAKARYQEIVDIVTGNEPKTNYYTEENGKVIKSTINLEGNDWNFNQKQVIDTTPTLEDFKKTVSDYLSWKVSRLMKDS